MQILLNIHLTKSVKHPDRSSCVLIFRLRRRFPRFISSPFTLTWRQRLRRLNCCLSKPFGSNAPSGCHYNNIMIFRGKKMCFIHLLENQNFFYPLVLSRNYTSGIWETYHENLYAGPKRGKSFFFSRLL